MMNLQKLKELFNFCFCSELLQDPVVLPCGQTVCKIHSTKITEQIFSFCSLIHSLPRKGFPTNKFVQVQLDMQQDNLEANNNLDECQKILKEMKKKIKELESIKTDNLNYIYEYFAELRRQVDLRRDNLIYQIEQFSNETIEEIYRLQLECADKLQKNEQKRNGESIGMEIYQIHSNKMNFVAKF